MNSGEQKRLQPKPGASRVRTAIALAVFLIPATALVIAIGRFAYERQTIGREIALLTVTRDELQSQVDRLDEARDQAESNKQVVQSLLAVCRSAEDIPDLNSPWIVTRRQNMENLYFYVPEGAHTLKISCAWKPVELPDTAAAAETDADSGQETSWSVPLSGDTGYRLHILSDPRGEPIQWELTSNDPHFASRLETIPLDNFRRQGSSWSVFDVTKLPNQLKFFSVDKLETAVQEQAGVELMETTINGRRDDMPWELNLGVRLLSEGPACVTASDAQRIIILGRGDALLPYSGGGKYQLGAGDRPQATGSRPQDSDSRPQASGSRPQAPDSR